MLSLPGFCFLFAGYCANKENAFKAIIEMNQLKVI